MKHRTFDWNRIFVKSCNFVLLLLIYLVIDIIYMLFARKFDLPCHWDFSCILLICLVSLFQTSIFPLNRKKYIFITPLLAIILQVFLIYSTKSDSIHNYGGEVAYISTVGIANFFDYFMGVENGKTATEFEKFLHFDFICCVLYPLYLLLIAYICRLFQSKFFEKLEF